MDNPMINLANTLGNYSDKPDKYINSEGVVPKLNLWIRKYPQISHHTF